MGERDLLIGSFEDGRFEAQSGRDLKCYNFLNIVSWISDSGATGLIFCPVKRAQRKRPDKPKVSVQTLLVWISPCLLGAAYDKCRGEARLPHRTHIWEKEVREYFRRQLLANNQPSSVLKQKGDESFVSVVRRLIDLFNMPELGEHVDQLDRTRERVKLAKHHPGVLVEHFVSMDDYWALLDAVEAFWEKLDGREEVIF
jgi:hypothetical protein